MDISIQETEHGSLIVTRTYKDNEFELVFMKTFDFAEMIHTNGLEFFYIIN